MLAKPKAYYEALLAEVAGGDPYQSFYNEWMWSYIVSDGRRPRARARSARTRSRVGGSVPARHAERHRRHTTRKGARAPLPAWPLVVIASVFYQRFLV